MAAAATAVVDEVETLTDGYDEFGVLRELVVESCG